MCELSERLCMQSSRYQYGGLATLPLPEWLQLQLSGHVGRSVACGVWVVQSGWYYLQLSRGLLPLEIWSYIHR